MVTWLQFLPRNYYITDSFHIFSHECWWICDKLHPKPWVLAYTHSNTMGAITPTTPISTNKGPGMTVHGQFVHNLYKYLSRLKSYKITTSIINFQKWVSNISTWIWKSKISVFSIFHIGSFKAHNNHWYFGEAWIFRRELTLRNFTCKQNRKKTQKKGELFYVAIPGALSFISHASIFDPCP